MSISKPKNGMFRHFKGIRTAIEPSDVKAYRRRLPEVFGMPEQPLISVFVADYLSVFPWPMTRYQEGAAYLKCAYRDREYWHCLTMPVTGRVPMWGGRRMGYPKFIADEIVLEKVDDMWRGRVTYRGRILLHLEFTPGFSRELSESETAFTHENRFFVGNSINMVPPKKGPAILTVSPAHKQEAEWNPAYGMIQVKVDPGEELAGLFDADKPHIGMFNEFHGGFNLDAQRLA